MKPFVGMLALVAVVAFLAACEGVGGSAPLIDYQRTGGIAGFDDHLTVQRDGVATLSRRAVETQFALGSDELGRLETLFAQAGFQKMRREYLPDQPGADRFEYRVTYKGHTVRTFDGAVPQALEDILDELNRIVATRGAN